MLETRASSPSGSHTPTSACSEARPVNTVEFAEHLNWALRISRSVSRLGTLAAPLACPSPPSPPLSLSSLPGKQVAGHPPLLEPSGQVIQALSPSCSRWPGWARPWGTRTLVAECPILGLSCPSGQAGAHLAAPCYTGAPGNRPGRHVCQTLSKCPTWEQGGEHWAFPCNEMPQEPRLRENTALAQPAETKAGPLCLTAPKENDCTLGE